MLLGDLLELVGTGCLATVAFLLIGLVGLLAVIGLYLIYQAHLGTNSSRILRLPRSRLRQRDS